MCIANSVSTFGDGTGIEAAVEVTKASDVAVSEPMAMM